MNQWSELKSSVEAFRCIAANQKYTAVESVPSSLRALARKEPRQ